MLTLKEGKREGIVFKQVYAPYTPGRPNLGGNQLKHKFVATLSALVANVNSKRSIGISLFGHNGWQMAGNVTIPPNQSIPKPGDVVEKGRQVKEVNDPLEALIAVQELGEKSVVILKDFHLFLTDPNPVLIRQFKDVLQTAKTKNKTLIIVGCRLCLPPELEREITVVEFSLPDKEQLGQVLSGIVESAGLKSVEPEVRDRVLDAAAGLTTIEAENAFALSVVQCKGIEASVVAKEKAQAVKKNGLLEIIETGETLESIGGLDVLKDWLLKRRLAFSHRAIQYGLPALKGVLILHVRV